VIVFYVNGRSFFKQKQLDLQYKKYTFHDLSLARLRSLGFMPPVSLNMVKIVPGFEPRILAISLKPFPFFHSSKTDAFSFAVNVRLIQQSSATTCFHMTVALTD
jgi:hypothetical protein